MKINNVLAGLVAAVAFMSLAAAAQAKTYLWNFTDGTYSGSGTLTTNAGETLVTSGTGTVTGPASFTDTLTLFVGATGTPILSPDGNWLYDNSFPIDFSGLLFTGVSNSYYNLYTSGTNGLLGFSKDGVSLYNGGNNIFGTLTLTAVPEPMTWALMLVGVGGMGVALRRSRLKPAGALA